MKSLLFACLVCLVGVLLAGCNLRVNSEDTNTDNHSVVTVATNNSGTNAPARLIGAELPYATPRIRSGIHMEGSR